MPAGDFHWSFVHPPMPSGGFKWTTRHPLTRPLASNGLRFIGRSFTRQCPPVASTGLHIGHKFSPNAL
ncbi:UNVERIFIED_CONTAM: hypothetical protein Sradi_1043300 [Sesamum radiatum]|uniref:Uncharacterized protein n=1 Tax=Sesamum radiatum TaxID=300843 RepID=A0AAW2V9B8_SESRA